MRLRRPLPAVQGDTLHIVGVGDNRIGKVNSCSDNVALTGPSNICFKTLAQLLTGRQDPYVSSFSNGVCACLERADDGAWAIQWMNRPEQL